MDLRVCVTEHAIARWRERGAVYGDEGEKEVESAFRASALVTEDDYYPFARLPGCAYYRHPLGWFVVEPTAVDHVRLVTFIPVAAQPGTPETPPLPPEQRPTKAARREIGRLVMENKGLRRSRDRQRDKLAFLANAAQAVLRSHEAGLPLTAAEADALRVALERSKEV